MDARFAGRSALHTVALTSADVGRECGRAGGPRWSAPHHILQVCCLWLGTAIRLGRVLKQALLLRTPPQEERRVYINPDLNP